MIVQFQQLTRIEVLTVLGIEIAPANEGRSAQYRIKIYICVEPTGEKPKT